MTVVGSSYHLHSGEFLHMSFEDCSGLFSKFKARLGNLVRDPVLK